MESNLFPVIPDGGTNPAGGTFFPLFDAQKDVAGLFGQSWPGSVGRGYEVGLTHWPMCSTRKEAWLTLYSTPQGVPWI